MINHSEVSDKEIKAYNKATRESIEKWIENNSKVGIQFYAAGPVVLQKKWAGAGLARKKGMDEALRRFNVLAKPEGIIVSLDADTLVEKNYLIEIGKHFRQNPKNVGVTLAFEHQKRNLDKNHLKGIELYEKYLAYYKNAIGYTGYPYSMFTIGSAFAVTALAYVKRGGMNRRKAGEDFYFLQNLVQIGKVGELKTTKVYPSSRLSDRVPFGTGPILQKWMKGEEDLALTYNFNSFVALKELFDIKDKFYRQGKETYEHILDHLPVSIADFLKHDLFWNELEDLNKNCSSLQKFQTRFYHKFNAFKILKYLNFTHPRYYEKADLSRQFALLNKSKIPNPN